MRFAGEGGTEEIRFGSECSSFPRAEPIGSGETPLIKKTPSRVSLLGPKGKSAEAFVPGVVW